MKRESGESPEQSRCCEPLLPAKQNVTGQCLGRRLVKGGKSEDLQDASLLNSSSRKGQDDIYQMKRTFIAWGAMALYCNSATLSAQNINIDTVEVNARRLIESERAAAPMQALQRQELERMGVNAVSDAVKHISGVQVKDYGGIGGLKTISVRSLGAQHTAVMYDGVAVSDCQTGQVDLSRYAIDNVENLTLTIGQSDNIFQSAKQIASAGVLNINTFNASLSTSDASRTTEGFAKFRTGTYGLVNPTLLFKLHPSRSTLHASLYADYMRADGAYRFHMMNGSKSIDEKRNNSDINAWRAETNLAWIPSDRQRLQLKAYLFDSDRGLPGSVVYDNPYAAERSHDRNYFGQLNYENHLSDRWKLSASAKYNWTWSQYTDKDIAREVDDRFRQTELYSNAVVWHQPAEGWEVSMAQDFGYNYLHANTPQCIFPSRYTLLTALSSRYSAGRFTATASLLNTVIIEEAKADKPADDRHRLSPAVSVSMRLLNHTNWRVRASYKDIFRNPTFNDLYYLMLGNRNLRPEKTHQWNIGTVWSQSFHGWLNFVNLSVDAYYGRVTDKIVAIPKMFFWTMFNIGKVETKGVDVTAMLNGKCPAINAQWYASATYNYMNARDVTDRTLASWHDQLPYTPLHSGSASITIEHPIVSLTYNLIWTGPRYSMQINMPTTRMKAYADHSISLYRIFTLGANRLRLQADMLNIGNRNYEVVRFYPMPGRNYQCSIQYYF